MTDDATLAAHWQDRLTELALAHRVPGASLAVLRPDGGTGDGDVVEAVHGVLSHATGVEVTPDSVFQIGSISKVWTTTLLMQLADEGKLTVDRPVAELVPDLRLATPELTAAVTVRHLLTHTSGIDGDVFTDTGRGDDCVAAYVARLSGVAVNHPLGATLSYCNSGFVLAGRVVEVLTGQTWDEALGERLIRPLGLAETCTLPEEAVLRRAAVGHIGRAGEQPEPTPVWGLPRSAGPAGLIVASARDVLAFARMHLRDGCAPDGTRLLSTGAVAAMREPQAEIPGAAAYPHAWGLGWALGEWDGEPVIGHDGNTVGQSACLRVLPEHGVAVALLMNGGETKGLVEDLLPEVVADVAGVSVPAPPRPPAHPPAVDSTRHLGTYERAGQRCEVLDRDGELVLRTTSTSELVELHPDPVHEYPMIALAEDRYLLWVPESAAWSTVTFYRLDDGSPYLHFGTRATPKVA
ncbi:MAG TPA: serine hydrolase domain-containing protein [Streptosporangiales bacterium]